jgi:hypothetical protein
MGAFPPGSFITGTDCLREVAGDMSLESGI